MSFKCSLTSANKKLRKLHIMNMYNAALKTGCLECYFIVLMWMCEYICSFFYIDTDADVLLVKITKDKSLGVSAHDISFLKVFTDMRNEIAHLQTPVTHTRFQVLLTKADDTTLFRNFEEDAKEFQEMLKICCNFVLGSPYDDAATESSVF